MYKKTLSVALPKLGGDARRRRLLKLAQLFVVVAVGAERLQLPRRLVLQVRQRYAQVFQRGQRRVHDIRYVILSRA